MKKVLYLRLSKMGDRYVFIIPKKVSQEEDFKKLYKKGILKVTIEEPNGS